MPQAAAAAATSGGTHDVEAAARPAGRAAGAASPLDLYDHFFPQQQQQQPQQQQQQQAQQQPPPPQQQHLPPRVAPAPSRAPAANPFEDLDADLDYYTGHHHQQFLHQQQRNYNHHHHHHQLSTSGGGEISGADGPGPASPHGGAAKRRASFAGGRVSFASSDGGGGFFGFGGLMPAGGGGGGVGGLWEGPVALNGVESRSRALHNGTGEGYEESLPLISAASDFAGYATLRCRAAFECAAHLAESPRLPAADAKTWTVRRAFGLFCIVALCLLGLRFATPENLHAVVLLMRRHRTASLALYLFAFTLGVVVMLPGMLFAVAAGAAFGFWTGVVVSFVSTVIGGLCGNCARLALVL